MPEQHEPAARPLRRPVRRTARALSALVVATTGLVLAGPAGPAAAAPVSPCHPRDNGDPRLTAVDLTTDAVDVTDGGDAVLVTVRARDTGGPGPASGLKRVQVTLAGPSGEGRLSAPLVRHGRSFVGSLSVPRGTAPGQWTLAAVRLADAAGNRRTYRGDELAEVAGTPTVTVTSVEDGTGAELTGLTLSTGLVDTRARARTLRVGATAQDAGSGVASIWVRAGDGRRQAYALLTGAQGRFTGRMTIPRWQGSRTWRVNQVTLTDRAGNVTTLRRADLDEAGLVRTFEVESAADTDAPRVGSVTSSTAAVDLRNGGAAVDFTVRAGDAKAGVDAVVVRAEGPGGAVEYAYLRRVDGAADQGLWRGTARFGGCEAPAGTWRVFVDAYDAAGNRATSRAGTLRVLARDHRAPGYRLAADVLASGEVALGLRFTEPVTGIDARSAVVRPGGDTVEDASAGSAVPGTWSCRDATGEETSCATGPVSTARFLPDPGTVPDGGYQVTLNPEGSLGVTDLAGNPFDRDTRTMSESLGRSMARAVTRVVAHTLGSTLPGPGPGPGAGG